MSEIIETSIKPKILKPNKNLGQNFLIDPSICTKIALAGGDIKDKIIIEVGPGPGALTCAILEQQPKKLIVIEKDKRFADNLISFQKYYNNLEIIIDDAMKVKLESLTPEKFTVISNLPYHIGTRLLVDWLDKTNQIEKIVVMLQKEVVNRICAKNATKDYGKLSILCQMITHPRKIFDVKPGSFFPPPKIHSSVVVLTPKESLISLATHNKVKEIINLAFMQRRKMLKSSLKNISNDIVKILASMNIKASDRAENLSVTDYIQLAEKLL